MVDMDDRTLLGRPEPATPATPSSQPVIGVAQLWLAVAVFGAAMFVLGLVSAPGTLCTA